MSNHRKTKQEVKEEMWTACVTAVVASSFILVPWAAQVCFGQPPVPILICMVIGLIFGVPIILFLIETVQEWLAPWSEDDK